MIPEFCVCTDISIVRQKKLHCKYNTFNKYKERKTTPSFILDNIITYVYCGKI